MKIATDVRPPVVTAIGWLAALMAAGSTVMAVAHAGVRVPLVSALGPGGDAAVPPAAAAFTVGAVLFAIVAVGLFQQRPWAWAAASGLFTVALASSAVPFRGAGSAVGIAVCLVALVLLLAPPGRRALLPRTDERVQRP